MMNKVNMVPTNLLPVHQQQSFTASRPTDLPAKRIENHPIYNQ